MNNRHYFFTLSLIVALTWGCKPEKEGATQDISLSTLSDTSVIAKPVDYAFDSEETFKVLSWNVEHFVDPFDDPYINHPKEDKPAENLDTRLKLLINASFATTS